MRKAVFTHLLTGKELVIFRPEDVILGLLLGKAKEEKDGPERTWLLLKESAPIPVEQSMEEVETILKQTLTQTKGEQ